MMSVVRGAFLVAGCIVIVAPLRAFAARFSFGDPLPASRPASSDAVTMPIYVSVDASECINAVQADILLPVGGFQYFGTDTESSEFDVWIERDYKASTGVLHLVGGTTRGALCGSPAASGRHYVASIILRRQTTNGAVVRFGSETKVALSDGLGTLVKAETQPTYAR